MEPQKATPSTSGLTNPLSLTQKETISAVVALRIARGLASEWLSIESVSEQHDLATSVATVFGVSVEDIYGPRRYRNLVKARHVFWACLLATGWSKYRIAKEFRCDRKAIQVALSRVPADVVEWTMKFHEATAR